MMILVGFRVGVEVAGYDLQTMTIDNNALAQLVVRYTVPRSTEVENLDEKKNVRIGWEVEKTRKILTSM